MSQVPFLVKCFGIVNVGTFQGLEWESNYRFEQEWASAWCVTTWKKGGMIGLSVDDQPKLPITELLSPDSDLLVGNLECLGLDQMNRRLCLEEAQSANIRIYVAHNNGMLLYPFPLDPDMLAALENSAPQRSPTVEETVSHLKRATSSSFVTFTAAESGKFEFSFEGRGFCRLWTKKHTFRLSDDGGRWIYAHNGQNVSSCGGTYGQLLASIRRDYQYLTR
ncbi:MAG: hypothetical protein K2X93_00565 [Candidatus Obscuribacterales bacterium]|nr:hypothetical protein [Candidatus Obscuribacterales bacterium]